MPRERGRDGAQVISGFTTGDGLIVAIETLRDHDVFADLMLAKI